MDSEDPYLSQREVIERVIRLVSGRNRLGTADAEEFAGNVRLKLVENDYAVLRKFQHRSSLKTYLTAVVQRMYLDYRNSTWGKWRPSAEARRMGCIAVLLERLLHRDGLSFEQAAETLATKHQVHCTSYELETMQRRLPQRLPRVIVSDEILAAMPAADGAADASLARRESDTARRSLCSALDDALCRLPAQDRLLVQLRYYDDLSVAEIARMQRLEQKPLYHRLNRALATLREALVSEGFALRQVAEVLEAGPWATE